MCMGWGQSIISVIFIYFISFFFFFNPTPDLDYFRDLRDTFSIALFSNAEWSQWGEGWEGRGRWGGGKRGERGVDGGGGGERVRACVYVCV